MLCQAFVYSGLVSTGNKFPSTILKIIFANQKNILKYFINILICTVDKRKNYQVHFKKKKIKKKKLKRNLLIETIDIIDVCVNLN